MISPPNTEGDTDLYEDGVLPGGWGSREGLSSKPFSASSPQKNAGSQKLADMRRKRSPAARVVGSFDHAVLPMPPVSDQQDIVVRIPKTGGCRGKQSFQPWISYRVMLLPSTKSMPVAVVSSHRLRTVPRVSFRPFSNTSSR